MGGTAAGVILGTAAYMSPEQAKGRPLDKRTDIWSFGVVLYEMLTGKKLFYGETATETLAGVLKESPDFERVPSRFRLLLRKCLEKDRNRRLRDIGDAMLLLEAAQSPPVRQSKSRFWPGVAAALLALAALALAFLDFRPKATLSAGVTRFDIAQPSDLTFLPSFAISPDGRKLAFVALGSSRTPQIWIRSLDAIEPHPLAGTEGVGGVPFWSPDSRYLVFWAGRLQKIEVSGGPAQTLCDAAGPLLGGFWSRDGKIVFGATATSGLLQVSAAGGTASPLTAGGLDGYPSPLPDGRHFVYTRNTSATTGAIYIGSMDTKP